MEISIRQIGNSKGIIIPTKFLNLIGLKEKAEINIENDKIVITPVNNIRANWEKSFINANSKEDNTLLIPDTFEDDTTEDWTW